MSITDKIGGPLGKKLGPVPVWGWGVIGAAGIWIFRSMGIGKPSPARTSSWIGRVSLGSGSGGAMPGSYPPPIRPAFGAPTPVPPDNWWANVPPGWITPPDFTLVGPNEEPTEVSQQVSTIQRWGLYWLSDRQPGSTWWTTGKAGSYIGVYPSRLAAVQASQQMDSSGTAMGIELIS